MFQLIDIVGSTLDRPLIKNEFTAKYTEILVMLEEEIVICEVTTDYPLDSYSLTNLLL